MEDKFSTIGKEFTWVKGGKPEAFLESRDISGIPYLSASYLRTGIPDFWVDLNNKSCVRVDKNDVVLIWDGSNAGDVFKGLAGVLSSTMVKFNLSNNYINDFLYFLLKNQFSELNGQTTGSTIPHVSGSALKEIKLMKISVNDQKMITEILNTIQYAISEQEKLIEKLKELKRGMMQHLFTKGTKGEKTKITEIGEIPESWVIKKVSDLVTVSSGGTPNRNKKEYWEEGKIPWVKTTEVNYSLINDTSEKITELGLEKSSARIFPVGTLLMAMYGQGVTRGRVGILNIEAATNQACAAFIGDSDLNLYLFYYLTHSYERLRILGHGANQKNLNSSLIKSFEIPLPNDSDEMIKIIYTLKKIDTSVNVLQDKLQSLRSLFRTLLHELMSGERKIKNI